jgi:hypothetical protein
MKLVVDNQARFARMAMLAHVCSQDIINQPLPRDMVELLMAMDLNELEGDLTCLLGRSGPQGQLCGAG